MGVRRSPQDVVYALSFALKEGKKGDEYYIADLAKRTEMHYMTVNNYLTMIEYIQSNIPRFEKTDRKGNAKITISQELEMDISDGERFLLRLFDKGVAGKGTAVKAEPFEGELLEDAIARGYVVRTEAKIHLSRSGIMKAADLADEREERVICSPMKAYSEINIESLLMDHGLKWSKRRSFFVEMDRPYPETKEQINEVNSAGGLSLKMTKANVC